MFYVFFCFMSYFLEGWLNHYLIVVEIHTFKLLVFHYLFEKFYLWFFHAKVNHVRQSICRVILFY